MSSVERQSLESAVRVFSKREIVVAKPATLSLSALAEEFPQLRFESFDDAFFRGISGYNRLMMSDTFYERFADKEYLLIFQLDAYAFRDDLDIWTAEGYDYVGAPWLKRRLYKLPIVSQWLWLKGRVKKWRHKPSKQMLYDRVGNGGLSLRRVSAFRRVLREQRDRVDYYLQQKRHHLYNEDVFWSVEPKGFRYPTAHRALLFSFDKYPAYCFKLTGGTLPMGCHAWYKRRMKSFWLPLLQN
jgi:hypothetical protein